MFIVEASGRRLLLLCGFAICCVACVLLTVALSFQVQRDSPPQRVPLLPSSGGALDLPRLRGQERCSERVSGRLFILHSIDYSGPAAQYTFKMTTGMKLEGEPHNFRGPK